MIRFCNTLVLIMAFLLPCLTKAQYSFVDIDDKDLTKLRRKHSHFFDKNTNLAELDEIIRQLMSTGSYERVAAYRKGSAYIVKGTTLKMVEEVIISGNRSVLNRQIFSLINIKKGDKFDKKKVLAAGDRLKEYYGQIGFFNAEIEISFQDLSPSQIQITFAIRENQVCKINQLHIQTDNTQLKERLEKKFSKFIGEPFSESRVREIEEFGRDYLKDNRFLQANLRQARAEFNEAKTEAHLYYTLDHPFRYEFIITGNNEEKNSRASLLRAIRAKEYEGASLDPTSEAVQRLRNYYLKKGYAHVEIEHRVREEKEKSSKYVYLTIEEGPRVRIKEIIVTGSISRPSSYYSDFIRENSSSLIESGYYNREDLVELGYKNLTTHLNNQGYLRAKMQPSRVEFTNDGSQVVIHVALEEGPLTQVRNISFNGNKAFSDLELQEILKVKSNAPLRLNKLEESILLLKDHYWSRGYLEMNIKNQKEQLVSYNDSGTQANIKFDIHEGPKVIVSSIAIEGNTFTKDYVILREIDFEIGDVLTSNKVTESRRRLSEMGLFGRTDISTLEAGTNISQRTVVISVQEQDPGTFKLGFGVTNDQNFSIRGYTGYSYLNLWGTARAITSRIDIATNPDEDNETTGKINVGYYEPFLFGSRTRGRVNTRYERELFGEESIIEDKKIDFFLEREFSRHFKMIWTLWGLTSRRQISREDGSDDTQEIASLGPSLEFDYSNDRFNPSKGYRMKFGLEFSDPLIGSSERVSYVRSDATYTFYVPVNKKGVVWGNSVRGGAVGYSGNHDEGGIPISKLYNIGGYSLVRGYGGSKTSERIPSDSRLEFSSTGTQIVETGNASFYVLKTELRFPFTDSVSGLLFYDYGEVKMRYEGDPIENPIGQSVGTGFHFNTPVGPVVFALAWKVKPRPDQKHGARIHFSVGSF